MEAYCRGESSNGEPHHRAITSQDRRELEKARFNRDQMESRHSSAINVLRGEQNRRMMLRLQRQDEELEQLERKQERELRNLEKEAKDERREWEDAVRGRRERMEGWWELEIEIWRKRAERETGVPFDGSLPLVPWPSDEKWAAADHGKQADREGGLFRDSGSRTGAGVSQGMPPMKREPGISTSFAMRGSVVGRA